MGRHEEWEYRCGRFCHFHGQYGGISDHLLGGRVSGRLSFERTGAQSHYAPDAPVLLQNVHLDLDVDPSQRLLKGKVTNTLRVVTDAPSIRLDAVGLKIQNVSLSGAVEEKSAAFEASGQNLWIRPKTPLKAGNEVRVTVEYEVVEPKRGLYFTGPSRHYPKKPVQMWTQGEDEDNHFWFPTLDHPSQRATLEMKVRVPKGMMAMSNGALIEKKTLGAQEYFHYKLDVPVVTYLTTLVVGEFEGWSTQGPRGLPVEYYVEKGRKTEGERSFSRTPKMIEVFEQKTGVPYPFPKYAQIAVQDFIFGGMENASATTQTDLTLHDARAGLDFSSDPLVSHELAHQWFGDLVTCKDWAHAWLNEGFATFMERVWVENDPTSNGGADEAKYYSYLDWKDYSADDEGRYRRPIVCNRYVEPQDLFDTHLYQKGGLVLNLLREELGEAAFWKSVQTYLKNSSGKSVDTHDLIRAIEQTTGRNLRRFFDQWIFGEGYPELEVDASWDGDKKNVVVKVQQKQEKPFHFRLTLEAFSGTEKVGGQVLEASEAAHEVRIPLSAAPTFVRVDPGATIPKRMKFKRPREMAIAQLANDPDCMGRIEAAQFLVDGADRATVDALVRAFQTEKFWAVQSEIATCLGKMGSPSALEGLLSCLASAGHPKARIHVVRALGKYRDARAMSALQPVAASDASYFVEGAAIQNWAKLAMVHEKPATVVSFLSKKLEGESYRDTIRKAAFMGFTELPSLGRLDGDADSERARELLLKWAKPPHPMESRVGAIVALGAVLKKASAAVRQVILETFNELIDETDYRLHGALIMVLGDSDDPGADALLSRIRRSSVTTWMDAHSEFALKSLEARRSSPERLDDLKKQLDELKHETQALKDQVKGSP